MTEQPQWEYRVVTVGSMWGTRDGNVEARLNELGAEGWEVVGALSQYGSGKVTVVAKRLLTQAERRRRSYPGAE